MTQESSGGNVSDVARVTVSGAGAVSTALCGVMLPTDSNTGNGTIERTWDPNQTGFNPFPYSIQGTSLANQTNSVNVRCYKDIGSTDPEFGKVSSPKLIASCSAPYSCVYTAGQNNQSCSYYCQGASTGNNLEVAYSVRDRITSPVQPLQGCTFSTPGATPASGSGGTFVTTYPAIGDKIGSATCGSKTATCFATVYPSAPPTCSPNTSNVLLQNGQAQVTFTAGGGGSGSYAWSSGAQDGANPTTGSAQTFSTTYTTPGNKTVTITRGTGGSGSCTVLVEGQSTAPVVCQPQTQTISLVAGSATASFTAAGGSAPYTWGASGGTPGSGTGSSFSSVFTSAGTKTVTVTGATGGSATCSAIIVTGSSSGSCDINRLCADRNEGIIFNLGSTPAGKKVFSFMKKNGVQMTPFPRLETGVTPYSSTARYSIPSNHGAGEIAQYEVYFGVGDTENPNDIQATTNTTSYTVADCRQAASPTIEVCPASQTVEKGDIALFDAFYDPTGEIPGNCTATDQKQNVSNSAVWSSSNSAVAQGIPSVGGVFNALTAGASTIQATYAGVTAQGFLTVSNPSSNLSVALTANPSSGEKPLSTTITANVTTNSANTINYNFWWNCPNYSPSGVPLLTEAKNRCGDPTDPSKGAKFDGISDKTKSVFHTYDTVGAYAPAVFIEQGTSAVFVKQTVTVTQATLACTSFTASPTNYTCLNASCTNTRPPQDPTLSWSCTGTATTKCEVRTATQTVCSNKNATDTCSPTKPSKTTRYSLWCDGKDTGKTATVRVFDTNFIEIPP